MLPSCSPVCVEEDIGRFMIKRVWTLARKPFFPPDLCLFIYLFLSFFKTLFYCFCVYLHVYPLFGLRLSSLFLGRTCYPLLFSDFIEEKTWEITKKIAFLLVWNKNNYREIPSVVARHMCITTHISSPLPDLFTTPSPLSIVASANLRLLHLLLYSDHINHIQVLGFLPFPVPPVCSFPLVCDPCPIILHLF
jgi:hypothetical protein